MPKSRSKKYVKIYRLSHGLHPTPKKAKPTQDGEVAA